MGVREIQMGFRPFPPLRFSQSVCRPPELGGDQKIKQRHVFQIVATVLRKEIAASVYASIPTCAAVGGGHMRFGKETADGAGVAVIGQPINTSS
jgi:hypothetical protein